MRKVSIQTAQNISIHQNLAGIFERILAYILDIIILYGFLFTLLYLYAKSPWSNRMSAWSFLLILGLPYFLYFPIIQYYNNGQSLGKKIMKIRIVKTNNTHPQLLDFIIRWLFRMIEISMIPGLGLIFILFTKKKQRLGDIVAGTSVVSEKNKVKLSHTFMDEFTNEYKPVFKEAGMLKEKDIQLIKELFNNTSVSKKRIIYPELASRIEKTLGIHKPKDLSDEAFIKQIIKDYEYFSLYQNT